MKKSSAVILFWATAFVAILPFFILCFFSHPGQEDYLFDNIFREHNFWSAQKDLYADWNGRFFANAAESVCIKLHFVPDFYFALPLLLLLGTGTAAFFAVRIINRLILENWLSRNQVLQAAFIFLLLNIYLLADIASNFYWFSAAIVYQTPIILLLLLIPLLVKRFTLVDKNVITTDLCIVTLIILLLGCNETFAVAVIILLLVAVILSIKFQTPGKKIITIYFIIAFVTGLLILFTSGILQRQKLMQNNTSYITVMPVIAFRTFMVWCNIFKEPLFWVVTIFCVAVGSRFLPVAVPKKALLFLAQPKRIFYILLLLVIMVAVILTPLLLLAKGSFPDRALNNIIIIAAICFLVLAFIAGYSIFENKFNSISEKITPGYRVILTGAAMLLSVTYINAWKSVFSGYFYHAVLTERDKQFLQAKNSHQKVITIQSYNVVLQKKIQAAFLRGGFKTVSELLRKPPTTIPFFNEAEDNMQPGYRLYYGVDTIIIIKPDKP